VEEAVVRVLIVSQYFTPEVTAASARLHPLAAGLAERGHQVEVLCEVPNHPHGVVEPGYEGRLVQRRRVDGFDVTYVWVAAHPSKRTFRRLNSYASFAALAGAVGSLRARPDVILASSPPLSVGAVGAWLSRRFRVPWVLDVRDLWPEVAGALGSIRDGRAIRLARALERALYAGASAVTTTTQPFREHIRNLCGDPAKVRLLPNGTTRAWLEAGDSPPDRERSGLSADRFVWTYSGNVGLSQDIGTALSAAELLGEQFPLLVVGDGASRASLEQAAGRLRSGAVRFTGIVPPEEAARYMRASDALLVPLAPIPALGKSIPVKLYDACAIGRPVIVAAPGEARRIAEEHGIGLSVPPGDPRALGAAVRRLRDEEGLRNRLIAAAGAFAKTHLREDTVVPLEDLLASCVRLGR
jgi:glycosyltransferase involved in cell wall biosynthesis